MSDMGRADRDNRIAEEVRAAEEEWLESRKRRQHFKAKAFDDPRAFASSTFFWIRGTRRHIRRLLRKRFGVKVRNRFFHNWQYIASRKRFPIYPPCCPRDYYDYVQFTTFSNLLRSLNVQWAVMHSAYIKAYRNGEDPHIAAVSAHFKLAEMGPLGATPTKEFEPDDVLREMQAMHVAGWVGAHINLSVNRSLNNVLSESTDGSYSQNVAKLMQELLPATVISWDERESGEPLRPGSGEKNLVSRVEKWITDQGDQAAKLRRRGKLDDKAEPESPRGVEDEIEEFWREEERLAQRAEKAKKVKEIATPTEWAVAQLRGEGKSYREIAAQLGIAEGTVGAHLSSLRKALGA